MLSKVALDEREVTVEVPVIRAPVGQKLFEVLEGSVCDELVDRDWSDVIVCPGWNIEGNADVVRLPKAGREVGAISSGSLIVTADPDKLSTRLLVRLSDPGPLESVSSELSTVEPLEVGREFVD